MQTTQVEMLERTIQKTNEWLKAIQTELGTGLRQHAYVALRSTLHVLRDRLQPDEALHLGAQLPTLIRGIYYEGWRLVDRPMKIRKADEFLGAVAATANDPTLDPELAVRAVFKLLASRVTEGEIEDVKVGLPDELRQFWPS